MGSSPALLALGPCSCAGGVACVPASTYVTLGGGVGGEVWVLAATPSVCLCFFAALLRTSRRRPSISGTLNVTGQGLVEQGVGSREL